MTTILTEPRRHRRPAVATARRPHVARVDYLLALAIAALVAAVRVFTDANEIDSIGSLRAAITATCPILLAALGGLWAERAGVVNIGLEGQMLLGTWGAAYFTYWYGPYIGILGGAAFGLDRRAASTPSPR